MKHYTQEEMLAIRENGSIADWLVKLQSRKDYIHVTDHDGKLEGVKSVGTISFVNPICRQRMMNGESVCHECFAQNYGYRASTVAHLIINFDRLTSEILPIEKLPFLPSCFGRIESMGDVCTLEQVINYIHICRKNPFVRFAAWTKNLKYWIEAFKLEGKPENLSFVFSSMKLNKPEEVPEFAKGFVDAVFTVYSFDFVKEHNVFINCGLAHCMECGKCYNARNREGKEPIQIHEILKDDAAKYTAWVEAGRPAA